MAVSAANAQTVAQNTVETAAADLSVDDDGYRIRASDESEFDHSNGVFLRDWRTATDDYDDTEFGERMYNESSTPTKLEMLRLLSKDTPALKVFLHALSMGVGLEDMLQAAVRYEPSRGRSLATAAITTIPLLSASTDHAYSTYDLDDLDREQESGFYRVEDVATRFFEDGQVLWPAPDWFEGQYHFLASVAELDRLQEVDSSLRWYRSKSQLTAAERPIFVSLYRESKTILIDGKERIAAALDRDPQARLPVVFIFNKMRERSVDRLGFPSTIRGVQKAYAEQRLMVTPAPEWQRGEYHVYAELDEFNSLFELPEEDDFEPQAWQRLIAEAKKYSVNDTSFLFVVLASEVDEVARFAATEKLYAAWNNPRAEERFPYVASDGDESDSFAALLEKGLILNRPDLIAALRFLGVSRVPVAFYYMDETRVGAYLKGPRALIQAAIGAGTPTGSFGGGGGFTPPPTVVPPASPPGLQ